VIAVPANGAVNYPSGRKLGDVSYVTCSAGYQITGGTNQTCGTGTTSTGVWSGTTATCPAIQHLCSALTLTGGTVSYSDTGRIINTVANHTCGTGYTLNGNAQRTCQSSGSWTGSAPTCDAIANFCPALTAPTNGAVNVSGQTINSNAEYSCDFGYQLSNSGSATCQASATWSVSAPTCDVINGYCPGFTVTAGQVTFSDPNHVIGSTADLTCTGVSGSVTVTCTAGDASSGKWVPLGIAPTLRPTGVPTCGDFTAPPSPGPNTDVEEANAATVKSPLYALMLASLSMILFYCSC